MNFRYEKKKIAGGVPYIIGVDEVGRGSLAGPVVAGAVCFPPQFFSVKLSKQLRGVNDSKQLTPAHRELLAAEIRKSGATAIGEASAAEVDELNIHRATLVAMARAVENILKCVSCGASQVACVVDGKHVPYLVIPVEAVVKGDAKIFSIAAASIVAKVYRDAYMVSESATYHGYGWKENKGYGTKAHLVAIAERGLSALHRRSFTSHLPVSLKQD